MIFIPLLHVIVKVLQKSIEVKSSMFELDGNNENCKYIRIREYLVYFLH